MEQAAARPKRIHLGFLDGVRGLSAVWVLFYHAFTFTAHGKGGSNPTGWGLHGLFFAGWMDYGDMSVRIFLVLSGFLLMQPLAAGGLTKIPNIKSYFARRCRRILPGYYAVLVVSILGLWLFFKVAKSNPAFAHLPIPPLTWPAVWTHLLIVQNFSRSLQDTINGPLWTVGTEFQIYFIFPLLFLPLLKKIGPWGLLIVVGILCSQLGWISVVFGQDIAWNGSPFPLSFVVGMLAALFVFDPTEKYDRIRKAPWAWIGICLLTAGFAALVITNNWHDRLPVGRFYLEIPFILGCGALIAAGGLRHMRDLEQGRKGHGLLRFLGSKPMIGLAGFSYSLYLTHHPIVIILSALASKAHLPALISVYAVSAAALIICLPLAYLVSLAVEKPFLKARAKMADSPKPA